MDGFIPPDIAASGAGAPCGSEACASALSAALLRLDELEAEKKELRLDVIAERARAGSCSAQQKMASAKLAQERELVASLRRASKDALALQAEVDRLTRLVAEMGIDARKRSTIVSLRQEVVSLKKALTEATASKREVASLERETVRQGEMIEALQIRCTQQEAELARLRGTRATLSKATFGSKSEKQKKNTGKKRGQQRGAPGHGRTRRPSLSEKEERHDPPPEERVCPCCGEAYVANGVHESSLIEIQVKAHTRTIKRGRWRRGCQCPSAPREVTAPPALRLFPRTPYGISVWACVLYERYACLRPLRGVSRWMADQGLEMAPGTMADGMTRLAPMFAPLACAILAHQNTMTVRHGDETSWRIGSLKLSGRSQRAWMWNSVSADAVFFLIDPSRSAEVARKLFGSTQVTVFLVCDRYSAYRKLARELDGKVIMCLCRVHSRRDVIEAAAGQEDLEEWSETWVARFAAIFNLNAVRV